MIAAVGVELLKLRRSRLWWITALAFTLAAAMGGLFTYIAQDPDRARSLGLLGAKAQLGMVRSDWPGYLALVAQIAAVGGFAVFGLLIIWIFGREFSDHTIKDLLALPTSRSTIVLAKFTVAAGWSLLLTAYLFALCLAGGLLLALPGWSVGTALHGLGTLGAAAAMTFALAAPFALVATVARGYLAAFGALLLAVFSGQMAAILGYGAYFPWSVPALYTGLTEASAPLWSIAGVLAVGALAVGATAAWWLRADQAR
jgi:ABC-2 type transport system permease protein